MYMMLVVCIALFVVVHIKFNGSQSQW